MALTTTVALLAAAATITVEGAPVSSAESTTTAPDTRRFSDHFVEFLRNNPERNKFALDSYENNAVAGTFGGREDNEEDGDQSMRIRHDPVVFIHGNQDSALHVTPPFITGWDKHLEKFLEHGYTMVELYGLTHGPRNISYGQIYTYSCELIKGVRAHIEAVIAYTQASKIDVISHSMGVTIARAAIMGGSMHFKDGTCHIGESLAHKVDTFLGIAGAHYGLCYCSIPGFHATYAGCQDDGFWSGVCHEDGDTEEQAMAAAIGRCGKKDYKSSCKSPEKYGRVLQDLNERSERVGDFVVSTWTNADEILGEGTEVFGRKSSLMPGSDLTVEFEKLKHVEVKDKPTEAYIKLVTVHDIHKPMPHVSHHHHRNVRHNTTHRAPHRHVHILNYEDLQ